MFLSCEKCGKKLIERKSNGLWRFKFGCNPSGGPVVDLTIQGSIMMTCLRKRCDHVNVFNYFPDKHSTCSRN